MPVKSQYHYSISTIAFLKQFFKTTSNPVFPNFDR